MWTSCSSGSNGPFSDSCQLDTDPPVTAPPAGVILTRPGYYTYPAPNDFGQYMENNGRCVVQGLIIGRTGYGHVYFPDPIDISNMNFDDIVQFRNREVIIYPDETRKPAVGEGLNTRAQITLYKIYPRDKCTRNYVKNANRILQNNFVERLKHLTVKQEAAFVTYIPKTGSWTFKVKHFSKYGLTDSDDELLPDPPKVIQRRTAFTQANPSEKDVEEVAVLGLGGGLHLDTNVTSCEDDWSFLENSSPNGWPQHGPYTSTPYEMDPTESQTPRRIQQSSLFINLDSIPKESSISTPQRAHTEVISTPKIYKLPDISLTTPPQKVTITQRCYTDLGIFNDNTFKVGWAPGLSFYNKINPFAERPMTYNRIHCMNIDTSLQYNSMMPSLTDMLIGTFKDSEFTFDAKIPTLHIRRDPSYLRRQNKIFNAHAKTHSLIGKDKYLSSVWNLCTALWGPGDNSSNSRRNNLSDWLEKSTLDLSPESQTKENPYLSDSEIFVTIFKLLSFYKIPEASRFALKHRTDRLACLISQLRTNERFKQTIRCYIHSYTWKAKDIVLEEFKKIVLLLAGVPVDNTINVCDGLDWMRSFGLHLWYIAPAAAPIGVAFNLYKRAFKEIGYAKKPIPAYCDSDIQTTEYDLLYHIIEVYADSTCQLCKVLHPETHTANRMDYRLSWFMLQLFLSLNVGLIRDSEKEYLHVTFSSQLENMGHWKWAIVVLLYLENNYLKKILIRKILNWNLSASSETVDIERELVQVFKIPADWVHKVKAMKAKAKGHLYDYFQHSIYMKDGHQANQVFMDHIGPGLLINQQYDCLDKFISKLKPFSSCLRNWSNEVAVFEDYLRLQKSFSNESEGSIIIGEKLASLLRKLNRFPANNEKQVLCVAQMSQECVSRFKELQKRTGQGNYEKFIDIFRNACMTPDMIHHEILHVITDAVQESSPVSSFNEDPFFLVPYDVNYY